jgi:hypothetical protein
VLNIHIAVLNVLVTLVTDIILLLIMFFGLLRLGFHERGAFGLGRLLWKQVILLLLAGRGVIRLYGGPHSQGCHLAFSCHYRRSPDCGKWQDPCVALLSTDRDIYAAGVPLFKFKP